MPANAVCIMKYRLDPKTKMSDAQRKRLIVVADKADANIDYSDIAALTPEFWAVHRAVPVEPKGQVTLRIDREVLDYFRDSGAGYQTRINDVLRSFVMARTHGRR
jgi:uncharacterized protein (DUF4415 family)